MCDPNIKWMKWYPSTAPDCGQTVSRGTIFIICIYLMKDILYQAPVWCKLIQRKRWNIHWNILKIISLAITQTNVDHGIHEIYKCNTNTEAISKKELKFLRDLSVSVLKIGQNFRGTSFCFFNAFFLDRKGNYSKNLNESISNSTKIKRITFYICFSKWTN